MTIPAKLLDEHLPNERLENRENLLSYYLLGSAYQSETISTYKEIWGNEADG